MTSLDTLLSNIKQCDEDLKSAHSFLAEAHELVAGATAALAKAQEEFDRAVSEARGVPYSGPHAATGAISAAPAASAPATQFAGPLPPPVPVPPRADTGRPMAVPGLPAHLAVPDDREEEVG